MSDDGKIKKGVPITIRASKLYNQKGKDGEYLDIESFRKHSAEGWENKNIKDHYKKYFAGGLNQDSGLNQDKNKVTYPKPLKTKENKVKESLVRPNVLHNFASYNTLFTLSGLSESEIKNQKYLTNTPHDVIARSGGIDDPNISWGSYHHEMDVGTQRVNPGTWDKQSKAKRKHTASFKDSAEILAKGHDLFFENLNIVSTVGPNQERGLANFTKMEFEMHEPFGITLIEKMRAASFINGYKDYLSAPFLLTIQWKGTDEHGRQLATWYTDEYRELKDWGNPYAIGLVRKIPVAITRIEFDVDEGGARYHAVAVEYGGLAMDDTFKYPRVSLQFSARHLSTEFLYATNVRGHTLDVTSKGWVDEMEKKLKKQMDDEIADGTRQYADKYQFIVDPAILKYGREHLADLQIKHSQDTQSMFQWLWSKIDDKSEWAKNMPEVTVELDLTETSADMNTSLPKLFEDAVRTLVGYQELVERFWYSWGHQQLKKGGQDVTDASDVLKYYGSSQFQEDLEENQFVNWFMIKPNVNTDYKRFDKIRKTHPKTITYYAIPVKIHILKFIKPGISFGNVNWDKFVRKVYDYIYTGKNIDVQSLKIFFKTAYYMRNVRPNPLTMVEEGSYQDISERLEKKILQVLGKEDHPYPEPDKPLRQEPSRIKGKSSVSTADARAYKSQEFYDYITNPQVDMLRIELEILGDPAYICQDMYSTIPVGPPAWTPQKGPHDDVSHSFNAEQYQPLIKLNYRLPDETNLKEGVMFEKELSASENLFFNGIYQVTKVDSRFQNGEFTQVLYCVRMNNQKGKGTPAVTGDLKELVEKANEQDKKKIDAAAKINENVSSKVAYSEAEWNNTSASGEFEKKYNERLKKKKEEGVTVTYEGGATTKETHPILDENGKVIGHSWTKTTGGGVKTTTVNKNWRDLEKVKK